MKFLLRSTCRRLAAGLFVAIAMTTSSRAEPAFTDEDYQRFEQGVRNDINTYGATERGGHLRKLKTLCAAGIAKYMTELGMLDYYAGTANASPQPLPKEICAREPAASAAVNFTKIPQACATLEKIGAMLKKAGCATGAEGELNLVRLTDADVGPEIPAATATSGEVGSHREPIFDPSNIGEIKGGAPAFDGKEEF